MCAAARPTGTPSRKGEMSGDWALSLNGLLTQEVRLVVLCVSRKTPTASEGAVVIMDNCSIKVMIEALIASGSLIIYRLSPISLD